MTAATDRRRASSTRSTSPTATSGAATARCSRCGGTSRPSASSPTRSTPPSPSSSEQGYLDDARYAQRFAEDRRTLDAWGDERIERRLRAVGVAAELVDEALASDAAGGGRARGGGGAAASGASARRRKTTASRERALGLLVRKGYELELAYDAVRAFERRA